MKSFDQKIAFPFQLVYLVYFAAKGSFREVLGSVKQERISQNSTKEEPFGSARGKYVWHGLSCLHARFVTNEQSEKKLRQIFAGWGGAKQKEKATPSHPGI